MKTVYWIIGIVTVLGIAGAITWYFYSKKKTETARLGENSNGITGQGNSVDASSVLASTGSGTDASSMLDLSGFARKY